MLSPLSCMSCLSRLCGLTISWPEVLYIVQDIANTTTDASCEATCWHSTGTYHAVLQASEDGPSEMVYADRRGLFSLLDFDVICTVPDFSVASISFILASWPGLVEMYKGFLENVEPLFLLHIHLHH
jgi:hypothetical protein